LKASQCHSVTAAQSRSHDGALSREVFDYSSRNSHVPDSDRASRALGHVFIKLGQPGVLWWEVADLAGEGRMSEEEEEEDSTHAWFDGGVGYLTHYNRRIDSFSTFPIEYTKTGFLKSCRLFTRKKQFRHAFYPPLPRWFTTSAEHGFNTARCTLHARPWCYLHIAGSC